MNVAVAKESFPGERRVALVPAAVAALVKAGLGVVFEPGAGLEAGYTDEQYVEKGARLAAGRDDVFAADILLQVRTAGANPEAGQADLPRMRSGQIVIGMCDPLGSPQAAARVAERGATLFSLELLPRITRAQSMDVLSSMATVAGYRAVLLAAQALPRMFPMLMTAAGTVSAAKVFVVGAGVAGLQAIATARRLGAVVSAYDVRPAVKEQVQSLGGKFVEMELAASEAEAAGGYARAMDEEFYRKQREMMARVVAESDVVITTAAVPGKKAPILVTGEMLRGMAPGSVVVDLAAERGGNCDRTRPGETIVEHGVTILGPTNLPSEIPYHASQMYAKNITTFLLHLVKDGQVRINEEDEIIRETLVTRDGKVVNPRVTELLSSQPSPSPQENV
ncbi:MAG: Re/Si-specific NAD(P)(+) transhydrogenase subunit alpha [Rhodopirellula sp.]|nr:Re/Si-specific NAD(P)(+) transhydrogenase subunit alpha [Rhodopirellula sp.]